MIPTSVVFSSCLIIPFTVLGKVWWDKVSMVTRYDVISSTRPSHYLLNLPVFHYFGAR